MYRIGHSYDTHRLVKNRSLYLGGIKLDYEYGLLGHSDADVILHALSEALLGSLALGDLGEHFSDKDEKNKDLDSKVILNYCYNLVKKQKYVINNIDIMIYSESFKITPHKQKIINSIAKLLDIDKSLVSVKATTMEKLGFIGRNEAISCECVVLVRKV